MCSCGDPTEKGQYKLRLAHLANEKNTWHLAALKFKELVEERSQEKILVQVYPNSQLGGEMDLINSVQIGAVDLTISGESLQNWAPKAALLAVPYLFNSSEDMRNTASGEVGKEIEEEIREKAGLLPLTWFERGPRHLTSNRPILTPSELKGLKLRVPNVPLFLKVWQGLGAKPIPMSFGEVFTSLQQNTIEGQENPISLIHSASFFEVQKHVNLTAHVRSWIYLVMGEEKFKAFPPHLQAIIKKAAQDTQNYERSLFLKEENELSEKLRQHGMTFTQSDVKAFSSKAKPIILQSLNEDQSRLFNKIQSAKR